MVDKELTITESYDLHFAKKTPGHPKSVATYLEIISNLTDRLSEVRENLADMDNFNLELLERD